MKHKRFEENILVDEAYSNYGQDDKNEDHKKSQGIAKHFAETLEYEEKKKWFHQMPQEPSTISKQPSQDEINELRKEASSALHGDTLAYETRSNKSGSSDQQWARTLLNKGAIGDRVAAATILIQDSPVHNLAALRNLVSGVKPAKKKDGIVIIDALSELLVADLLVPEAKLRPFERRPLGHLDEITSGNKHARRAALKLWYYEDQLKELYKAYVEALNKFAHDSVEANREKAVSAMSYLLMHHPEREKVLLASVVNKLGDPAPAVACKATYHLCQLLYNHPNMKEVVLTEIEKMLFRSNVSARAQYYGVCFLNQFYLGKDDSALADNLIRIYFSFFKANIKKGEIDSRLMSAVLRGVKRAHPFAAGGAGAGQHVAAVHRLVHLANDAVAINALALLHLVSGPAGAAGAAGADRYYTSLYRKLSSPEIFNTNQSALLFSLIYKSLKSDSNVPRVTAFVKRLLQLCCYASPAHACGLLFLISQVTKDKDKKDAVKLVWTKTEVKDEIKEEATEDKEEKTEPNDTSTEANNLADAATGEAVKVEQKKIDLLKGEKKDLLEDDEEETYVDLKMDDEGNVKPAKRKAPAAGSAAGWHHARVKAEPAPGERGGAPGPGAAGTAGDRETTQRIQMKKTINMDRVPAAYCGRARDPAHCGAPLSAAGELRALAAHHHPTVRLFAARLLAGQLIQYSGDPLKDFSAIRFLDRFVFKNPKRREEPAAADEGGGGGAPRRVRGSHPKFAVRKNYAAKGVRALPVTSAFYLAEDAARIPCDERFLYDFLQSRRRARGGADGDGDEDGDEDEDEDEDAQSVTSEDFERYLDGVTGAAAAADASDEELDFLADMAAGGGGGGHGDRGDGGGGGDGGELDDDDDDDADSDGELELSADEEEPALSDAADDDHDHDEDEDELALRGSDDDELRGGPGRLKLKGGDGLGSLFASAEEFSTLLEETAAGGARGSAQGSSRAASTADGAGAKQLAWEDRRQRWIRGYNRKILGHKGNKFTKKRGDTNFNKMANTKNVKRKSEPASKRGAAGKRRKLK